MRLRCKTQYSMQSTEFKILLGLYKEPMSLAEVLTKSKECSVKKCSSSVSTNVVL